jgi:hypothetical protein
MSLVGGCLFSCIIIFLCKEKVLFNIGRMNSWDFGFGAWRKLSSS